MIIITNSKIFYATYIIHNYFLFWSNVVFSTYYKLIFFITFIINISPSHNRISPLVPHLPSSPLTTSSPHLESPSLVSLSTTFFLPPPFISARFYLPSHHLFPPCLPPSHLVSLIPFLPSALYSNL